MKRRGFLGLLGGAAVAGPGIAKQAVAGLGDLALPGISLPDVGWGGVEAVSQGSTGWVEETDWRLDRIAKLGLRTAEQHAFHKRRVSVHALDPDLAGYRSFSLARKVSIQQDRNYWKEVNGERSYLESLVAGFFD